MDLLIISLLAGVFTVAAPCILPLLPVVVGGAGVQERGARRWSRPLTIVAGLAVSVFVFSLLLKGTTLLLGVPQQVWQVVSGVIVMLLGVYLLFPVSWEKLMLVTGLYGASNKAFSASFARKGLLGDLLLGAALGPVFTSCSPTYALIIALILSGSFALGLLYLCAYVVGLAGILLLIAVAGQAVTQKLGWLSNPQGWFAKTIGVLFILVGLAVLFGLDKQAQTFVLEQGWYAPIIELERRLKL